MCVGGICAYVRLCPSEFMSQLSYSMSLHMHLHKTHTTLQHVATHCKTLQHTAKIPEPSVSNKLKTETISARSSEGSFAPSRRKIACQDMYVCTRTQTHTEIILSPSHTHTHAHMHTQIRTHTHTHKHTHTHTHTNTHTRRHTHTHAVAHARI